MDMQHGNFAARSPWWVVLLAVLAVGGYAIVATTNEGEHPRHDHDVPTAPSSPAKQTPEEAQAKSAGCVSCHSATDQSTMHANPGVVLGCTDCHGGRADVRWQG
ncbi:MAG: hypothetical protein EBR51_09170, partial [Gammaproteobacteria bacterium]|nr:hypothetical protein [Gammaproteobacteria bacterium]